MKKIAIIQSNYLPWKGYFDLIASVDEFIVYDDMQFTRRDWRNRNLIKTPQGNQWLTVPVQVKGRYHQLIKETKIDGEDWIKSHLQAFQVNYSRAKFFKDIFTLFEATYLGEKFEFLSHLNLKLIKTICDYLEIHTIISKSMDYKIVGGKTERLVNLCKQASGRIYISGPSAKDYLDPQLFANAEIILDWFNYEGYEPYPQLWGDFNHNVTILDLLFNVGRDSRKYMKSAKS